MKERLLLLLIFVVLSSRSLEMNPKVMVGQISDDKFIQQQDQITDSYQEMLTDSSKKLISMDLENENKLDLSKNIVIQNDQGSKQFQQKDKPIGLSYYTGTIDKDQEFNQYMPNSTQLAGSYKEMLQHKGQKLLTIGIDQKQIKDYDKYGYIDTKQEDPIYFDKDKKQSYNSLSQDIQITKELCEKENLLNYYDKHRLKIKTFFQKADQKQIDDPSKFKKIVQEMRQYSNNIQNRINELKYNQNNLQNIEALKNLQDIHLFFINNLQKYDQSDQSFNGVEQKDKIQARLAKIDKFISRIYNRQDLKDKQKQVLDEVNDFIQVLKQNDNQYYQVMDDRMKEQVYRLDNQIQSFKQKTQFNHMVTNDLQNVQVSNQNNTQNTQDNQQIRFKDQKVEVKKSQNQIISQDQSQLKVQIQSQSQTQTQVQQQQKSQIESQTELQNKSQNNEDIKQKQQNILHKVDISNKPYSQYKIESDQSIDSVMQMINTQNDNKKVVLNYQQQIEMQQSEHEQTVKEIVNKLMNSKISSNEVDFIKAIIQLQPDSEVFTVLNKIHDLKVGTNKMLDIMKHEYQVSEFNKGESDLNHRIGLSKVTDNYIQKVMEPSNMRFQKVNTNLQKVNTIQNKVNMNKNKVNINKNIQNKNKVIQNKSKPKNIESYRFNQKNKINQKVNQKQIMKQPIKQITKQPIKQIMKQQTDIEQNSIDDLQDLIDTQIQQMNDDDLKQNLKK